MKNPITATTGKVRGSRRSRSQAFAGTKLETVIAGNSGVQVVFTDVVDGHGSYMILDLDRTTAEQLAGQLAAQLAQPLRV